MRIQSNIVANSFALTAAIAAFVAFTVPSHAASLKSAKSDPGPKVVLELFTSQGCSSCPPADKLLGTYKGRNGVIVLSVPVDYWDRLGWKDTFASPAYSKRQREYAGTRGDGDVYTPQIVVNGLDHAPGFSARKIDRIISDTSSKLKGNRVAVSLAIKNDELIIRIGASRNTNQTGTATIWLATVQDTGLVNIGRGENGGRKLTYHNVARGLNAVGTWTGKPLTLRLAKDRFTCATCQKAIALVQQGRGGPIIGAAEVAVVRR